jgi:hypothetical protein
MPTDPKPPGLRRYGQWAGNPGGTCEDITRCIGEVQLAGGFRFGQCTRKRGHGPDGLWCKQHDPEVVAARDRARSQKWADDRAAERRRGVEFGLREATVEQLEAELKRRQP